MNHFIFNVIEIILLGRSPDIAITIPISFEKSVDCGDEYVASKIEFSIVYSG